MLNKIKSHWHKLKTEYENRYNKSFLSDFETSKEYLERMKSYLLTKQEECSSNVDVICTLASVELELRDEEFDYIEFLQDFLNEFENSLGDIDKARIYTNLAFWDDFSKDSLMCFNKAKDLNSPFVETYTGLGLYYFSEYEYSKDEKNLLIGHDYFKIARKMEESYITSFNYAVSLFELKEYEKAKVIFLSLLEVYPNRMRLLLCLAYCEVYLGNKDEAMSYVEKVKPGQDLKYNLNTDDISEDQIIDVYYALEEYDMFLNLCGDYVEYYYIAEWEEYFYVLWLKNQKERFLMLEEKNRKYFEEAISEAISDEDYESEKEKQEIIASWEEDKRKFEEMISKIKSGASRPEIKLKLYPEYSCFMVDCVRHKFI
ncbi:tetratricopeptide repeat protein [Parvimonas micra]